MGHSEEASIYSKYTREGLPGRQVVRTLLSLLRAGWVQSLVRELRSHKLQKQKDKTILRA